MPPRREAFLAALLLGATSIGSGALHSGVTDGLVALGVLRRGAGDFFLTAIAVLAVELPLVALALAGAQRTLLGDLVGLVEPDAREHWWERYDRDQPHRENEQVRQVPAQRAWHRDAPS